MEMVSIRQICRATWKVRKATLSLNKLVLLCRVTDMSLMRTENRGHAFIYLNDLTNLSWAKIARVHNIFIKTFEGTWPISKFYKLGKLWINFPKIFQTLYKLWTKRKSADDVLTIKCISFIMQSVMKQICWLAGKCASWHLASSRRLRYAVDGTRRHKIVHWTQHKPNSPQGFFTSFSSETATGVQKSDIKINVNQKLSDYRWKLWNGPVHTGYKPNK